MKAKVFFFKVIGKRAVIGLALGIMGLFTLSCSTTPSEMYSMAYNAGIYKRLPILVNGIVFLIY